MHTSQEFSVAVHALLMLMRLSGEKVTSESISTSSGCNTTNVRKIFAKLSAAGLIVTKSGKGRTTLAEPADQITLWDIYSAVEGENALQPFTLHYCEDTGCQVGSHIGELLTPHYRKIAESMKAEMSSVTLSALNEELSALV